MTKVYVNRENYLHSSYDFYKQEAVNHYFKSERLYAIYMYDMGVMFGIGFALGYQLEDMEDELASAIAVAKNKPKHQDNHIKKVEV